MTDINTLLKPCPLCGCEARLCSNQVAEDEMHTYVVCNGCDLKSGGIDAPYSEPDYAINEWNTRVHAASAPAQEPVAVASRGKVAFFVKWKPAGEYLIGQTNINLYAAPVDAQDAADAKQTGIPKFYKGDRVKYQNQHYATMKATVKKSETRWSRKREPYIFAHIIIDGQKTASVVSENSLTALQASQSPQEQVNP